ncbi:MULTISPECIES: TetR/AcrR family transcriptional regulator [unclassified Pseudofrankia]|uniref:TetR/AcrR family transcriptional regulator n=1 Tax=unclassified Pseudofrankia TaxID=2994372 RepID=UPI000AE5261B|nr:MULTISPECIES: TetR/AcrR family transcriptional regulator [unclassified Pseudofrankia]MDT3439112.1 TetR/AcrR family transcriptional regulator [Pseudofrankia sp. BMG5.37]
MSWAERAADRSPSVRRSRLRTIQQAKVIVQAARRLVDEKGDQFTTQELAREAGVALQTFYRHFPGKDQLLVAVIEDMIAENAELYAAAASHLPDPVTRLRFYITEILSGLTVADGAGDGGLAAVADGAAGENAPGTDGVPPGTDGVPPGTDGVPGIGGVPVGDVPGVGIGGVGSAGGGAVGEASVGAGRRGGPGDADAVDGTARAGTGPRFITAQHWRLHQRFPEDMAHAIQPITDLIARELHEAQAAGLLHPTDPDRDAALITKLVMTVYHHYAFAPPGEATTAVTEHLWSFCLTGLGGPAPAARPAATATRASTNGERV